MEYLSRLKENAKTLPKPVWIASLFVPGGLIAVSLYLAYKASNQPKQDTKPTHEEWIQQMIEEAEKEENDRS